MPLSHRRVTDRCCKVELYSTTNCWLPLQTISLKGIIHAQLCVVSSVFYRVFFFNQSFMLWLCFLKACHHRRLHPRSFFKTPLGGHPTPSSSTFFTFLHQKHARTKRNKIQILFIWVCVLRGMCVCGQQGSKGSNSYGPPHHTRTASTPFRPFKPPGSCTSQVLPCNQTDNGGKRRL